MFGALCTLWWGGGKAVDGQAYSYLLSFASFKRSVNVLKELNGAKTYPALYHDANFFLVTTDKSFLYRRRPIQWHNEPDETSIPSPAHLRVPQPKF